MLRLAREYLRGTLVPVEYIWKKFMTRRISSSAVLL
jgi:hypothetical protein